MPKRRFTVSPRLKRPTSESQLEKYASEIKMMFKILPEVCRDFNVPQPDVDFEFSRQGDRGGTYYWDARKISISPKPWQGSVLDVFAHEFAHHVQNCAGRLEYEFRKEFRDYDSNAGDGHGWSFYEILVTVIDHFEFIYGHVYDWTKEYGHIIKFRKIMTDPPKTFYLDESKIKAVMNLFQCSQEDATKRILNSDPEFCVEIDYTVPPQTPLKITRLQ